MRIRHVILALAQASRGLTLSGNNCRVLLRLAEEVTERIAGVPGIAHAGVLPVPFFPAQPERQLRGGAGIFDEPGVKENKGAVIVAVPNDPSKCLVEGSVGTQLVPLVAVHVSAFRSCTLLVVVHFGLDLGVEKHGVRNAHAHDSAAVLIVEADAF